VYVCVLPRKSRNVIGCTKGAVSIPYVCVRICTYLYVLGTKMHFWTDGVQSADFTEQLDGVLQAASTHRQSSSSMPTASGYTVRSTLKRCMRLHRSRQDQTCHQCLCFSAVMQRWSMGGHVYTYPVRMCTYVTVCLGMHRYVQVCAGKLPSTKVRICTYLFVCVRILYEYV
jgi:hypothetical protein